MENNKNNKSNKAEDKNIYNEIFIKGQIYKDVESKKSLWEELAKRFAGKFNLKHTLSHDIATLELEIPYKNRTLFFTESDTKPLRIDIELKLNRDFEFNISWEDGIEKILKVFGKQDIKIGDKQFDKKYLIQSNEKELITGILGDELLKQSILKNNIYLMNLEYSKRDEISKLMTVKDRNTNDIETLAEMVQLHFRMIDIFSEKGLILK